MPIKAALQIQSGLACPVVEMSKQCEEVTVLNPMYLPHWIEPKDDGESTRRLKRSPLCSSCELIPICRSLGLHITRFKAVDGRANIEVLSDTRAYELFIKSIAKRYKFSVYSVSKVSYRKRGIGLTPLRLSTMRLALAQGYYDFPRRASLKTIATQLGRSISSVDEQLRRAEKSMLEAFLENRVSDFIGPISPSPGQSYLKSSKAEENEFLANVFDSDRRIRMCVIKDKEGEIVAGGMRPHLKTLEPNSENKRLAQYEATQRESADSWNTYFGEADFMVEHRRRLVAFKFYLPDSRMVVVTAEPNYPVQKAGLLLEIVERFRSEA